MQNTSEQGSARVRDGLERTITLTDAVVAIAMTLLILPLVEVAGEAEAGHLGEFVTEYSDLFTSFAVSFLVIYLFWSAHGEAVTRLGERPAPKVRALTMWWLLVIAFLPFPTAVVGRELNTTSATLYIGTMTLLSALTSAISTVVDGVVPDSPRGRIAWLTTGVFLVCTLIALVNARVGLLGLLALVLVRVVEVRAERRARRG